MLEPPPALAKSTLPPPPPAPKISADFFAMSIALILDVTSLVIPTTIEMLLLYSVRC